ncbi:MAG: hypothetical protein J6Q79_07345 [Clostridia bacterium]|nr:hypothetical protein [Clostridia bacterium]
MMIIVSKPKKKMSVGKILIAVLKGIVFAAALIAVSMAIAVAFGSGFTGL